MFDRMPKIVWGHVT